MLSSDPFDLARFVRAQQGAYDAALAENRGSCKPSHWMWYVFPQLAGLGFSAMSQRYAIQGAAEAQAYLAHPVLGPRLIECAQVVLGIKGRSARAIFGSSDDRKLRPCATPFAAVAQGSIRSSSHAWMRGGSVGVSDSEPLSRPCVQRHV